LFTYAEELFDRIEADDPPDALYAYLDEVQTDKLEMAKSSAFREIVDRSVALVRDQAGSDPLTVMAGLVLTINAVTLQKSYSTTRAGKSQ
jgi:hypothetical protein